MLVIRPCTMEDVAGLVPDARKAGLVFSPSTALYGAWDSDTLVGMCGVVWYRGHVKLKDQYVVPAARGQGFFREMLDFSLRLARERGVGYVEATCTPMSLPEYHRRGAVILRRYAKYTRVRLAL